MSVHFLETSLSKATWKSGVVPCPASDPQAVCCLLVLGWGRSHLPEDGTGSPWSTWENRCILTHPSCLCSSALVKALPQSCRLLVYQNHKDSFFSTWPEPKSQRYTPLPTITSAAHAWWFFACNCTKKPPFNFFFPFLQYFTPSS